MFQGKNHLQAAAAALRMPLEYAAGMPNVTVTGLSSVRVEQHRGLAAYGTELVVVRGRGAEIHIRGSGLLLETMNVEQLTLRGRISAVELVY